ncbi:MAG: hypothetical protein WKF77_12255 [Planctomycetaceae bacterium]
MRTSVCACIPGLLLTLLCGSGAAEAQQVSGNNSSQRILPLPEGRLSDVQTQIQLLQRLRSLVADSEDTPKIDNKQLEQLQQALKKLQDQLPPGVKPPDLDSIPKEQLDEAMSNPAMQQQLKKMLEQFSKDGLLPKNDGDAPHSPMPPIPRRPGQSPTEPERPTTQQPGPLTQPGEQSWESLKNAMKKLSEIAQGGKKKLPEHEAKRPDDETPLDGDDPSPQTPRQRGSSRRSEQRPPRATQPRADGDRKNVESAEGEGEPSDDVVGNSETQQPPSLQAFQDLLQRYKDSQRNEQPRNNGKNGPESDDPRPPDIRPGMRSPRTENEGSASAPDPSKRVMRRPDRAAPIVPPVSTGPRTSEQGEVFPPAEIPSGDSPPSPAGNRDGIQQRAEQQSRNSSGSRASEPGSSDQSLPSVSEFLKEQLRKGFPTPGTNNDIANSKSPGANVRTKPSSPGDPGRRDSKQPGTPDPATGTKQSGVDIRSDLQKRGVRGTLDKLIQKAKEESIVQRKAQQQAEQESMAGQAGTDAGQLGNRSSQDAQARSPSGTGLQKKNWLTDRLLGMDDEVKELIKDAKFKERSSESRQPRDSTWQESPAASDSGINKWNDAASDFLSDLSKAPSAPAASRSSSGGGGSVSADTPLAIGSFLLVGLGLLGILAVVAFLMRRPLLKLVSDATGIAAPERLRQPSEIRSREDVITAFHALALNPKRLVESWWTHRAAAIKLAAESPQQSNAVQTLAEIYEQARYLPDDVDLPADKIQSARTAASRMPIA